jgi:hypothetical protein
VKLFDQLLRVNTGIPVVIKSLSGMQSCRSESGFIGHPSQEVATFIEWFIATISVAQMGLSCWLRRYAGLSVFDIALFLSIAMISRSKAINGK